ncbi:hypothetical protein ABK040_006019 [Willaertia magna]
MQVFTSPIFDNIEFIGIEEISTTSLALSYHHLNSFYYFQFEIKNDSSLEEQLNKLTEEFILQNGIKYFDNKNLEQNKITKIYNLNGELIYYFLENNKVFEFNLNLKNKKIVNDLKIKNFKIYKEKLIFENNLFDINKEMILSFKNSNFNISLKKYNLQNIKNFIFGNEENLYFLNSENILNSFNFKNLNITEITQFKNIFKNIKIFNLNENFNLIFMENLESGEKYLQIWYKDFNHIIEFTKIEEKDLQFLEELKFPFLLFNKKLLNLIFDLNLSFTKNLKIKSLKNISKFIESTKMETEENATKIIPLYNQESLQKPLNSENPLQNLNLENLFLEIKKIPLIENYQNILNFLFKKFNNIPEIERYSILEYLLINYEENKIVIFGNLIFNFIEIILQNENLEISKNVLFLFLEKFKWTEELTYQAISKFSKLNNIEILQKILTTQYHHLHNLKMVKLFINFPNLDILLDCLIQLNENEDITKILHFWTSIFIQSHFSECLHKKEILQKFKNLKEKIDLEIKKLKDLNLLMSEFNTVKEVKELPMKVNENGKMVANGSIWRRPSHRLDYEKVIL